MRIRAEFTVTKYWINYQGVRETHNVTLTHPLFECTVHYKTRGNNGEFTSEIDISVEDKSENADKIAECLEEEVYNQENEFEDLCRDSKIKLSIPAEYWEVLEAMHAPQTVKNTDDKAQKVQRTQKAQEAFQKNMTYIGNTGGVPRPKRRPKPHL